MGSRVQTKGSTQPSMSVTIVGSRKPVDGGCESRIYDSHVADGFLLSRLRQRTLTSLLTEVLQELGQAWRTGMTGLLLPLRKLQSGGLGLEVPEARAVGRHSSRDLLSFQL